MASAIKPRFKYLLAFVAALGVLILAACVEDSDRIGLDAISPDGRWAVARERSGDPPLWRLVRFDLENETAMPLSELEEDESFDLSSSRFSPDGRYLVFPGSHGWVLTDMITNQQVPISTAVKVQFLPDEKLLITSIGDGLTLHSADPTHPEAPTLLSDGIRYHFSAQPPDPLASSLTGPGCRRPRSSDQTLITVIKQDGTIQLIVATPAGVSIETLSPMLSDGVKTLLMNQYTIDLANSYISFFMEEELVEQEVKRQAADAGEILNDEELESRVDAQFRGFTLATLSSDGTKLLLLQVGSDQDEQELYDLYLVDLRTGAAPQILSRETDWMPSFAFSPDGRQILFESNRNGSRSLYIADSDGTDVRLLVTQDTLGACWH